MAEAGISEALEGNSLLAELLLADRSLVVSAVRIERPDPGQLVGTRDGPVADVWFPLQGLIALTVKDRDGRGVEAGIVGPDGCIGLDSLFEPFEPSTEARMQVIGPMAVLPVTAMRTLVDAHPLVQASLSRHLYSLSAQCLQTVACNRLHSLEQRCCRWLLMMGDCIEGQDLPLTQEALAAILGSVRPRVNALLAKLEHAGLLRRLRRRIRLLSNAGLQQRSCECYQVLRRNHGNSF